MTDQEYSVRAQRYALLQSKQTCWKCDQDTPVVGFLLPQIHETLWIDDEPALDEWEKQDCASIVNHITSLPDAVLNRIQSLSPRYKVGHSKMGGSYFMNSCVHCNSIQGDFFLYSEPGGAFFPTSQAASDEIQVIPVAEAFACIGDCSYGSISDMLAGRADF